MKGLSLAILVSLLGVIAVPQLAQAGPAGVSTAAVEAQQGRYQDAEVVWQRIARRNPESAEAYYNLGVAQANQQKWEAAIDSYGQAIALNSDFVPAHFNLGRAQAKLERYEAASRSYGRVLALDPQDSLAAEMLNELRVFAQSQGIDLAVLVEQAF